MHHTQDPGTTNLTDGTQGANRLSVPGHTKNYNAGIQYSRLLHRRCTSLDLEAAFKEIKISQNIEKEVCAQCRTETCRCPAFTPGMPCSSASSTPTNISDKQIPDLVENKPLQVLHPPVQSPSDKEADQEVAAICRAPEYYQVRLHVHHRHRYYMYNALDAIRETTNKNDHVQTLQLCRDHLSNTKI